MTHDTTRYHVTTAHSLDWLSNYDRGATFDNPPGATTRHAAHALREGDRAHAEHGAGSMRSQPWNHPRRMVILVEELGELARPLNDLELGKLLETEALLDARPEAVQVAAMALDWLAAIDAAIVATVADSVTS